MNDTFSLINHLVAALLAEQPPQAPVRLRQVEADESGLHVAGWLEWPQVQGEFRLRVDVLPAAVEPEGAPQSVYQTVRLKLDHCPERLPGLLAALRPLLERSQAYLKLEFAGATQAASTGAAGGAEPEGAEPESTKPERAEPEKAEPEKVEPEKVEPV